MEQGEHLMKRYQLLLRLNQLTGGHFNLIFEADLPSNPVNQHEQYPNNRLEGWVNELCYGNMEECSE